VGGSFQTNSREVEVKPRWECLSRSNLFQTNSREVEVWQKFQSAAAEFGFQTNSREVEVIEDNCRAVLRLAVSDELS